MYRESPEEVSVFDFDELAGQLQDQGSRVSPAEIHGCLSGLLTGGVMESAEHGLDALGQALDIIPYGELADYVMQLYRATALALQDEEFSFNLLLPDDEIDIELRAAALALWCSGFLGGLAHASAESGHTDVEWSADAREILADLAALSEVEADDGETDNEAEANYMELVEYLRFAVLNLFMERASLEDFAHLTRDPDEPLH